MRKTMNTLTSQDDHMYSLFQTFQQWVRHKLSLKPEVLELAVGVFLQVAVRQVGVVQPRLQEPIIGDVTAALLTRVTHNVLM